MTTMYDTLHCALQVELNVVAAVLSHCCMDLVDVVVDVELMPCFSVKQVKQHRELLYIFLVNFLTEMF